MKKEIDKFSKSYHLFGVELYKKYFVKPNIEQLKTQTITVQKKLKLKFLFNKSKTNNFQFKKGHGSKSVEKC